MNIKKKYAWPAAVALSICSLAVTSSRANAQELKQNTIRNGDKQSEASENLATKIQYMRQTEDEAGQPKSLQTAITRFVDPANTVSVDLIGAVHIGNKSYYEVLNELFGDYDVVLYELVAPEDSNIPQPGRKSTNPLSFLQNSAQNMLGLESQLAKIDYTKDNFVHADLSPTQLKEKMAERGQTTWTVAMSAFSEMMNKQQTAGNTGQEMSFGELMDTFNSPYKMRRMMAAQFAGEDLDVGLGETLNQLIVVDRNIAAMNVLKEQLELGHTKIAIFYGAAHMPDFEKRLKADLDLSFSRQAWLDAWGLRETKADRQNSLSPLMKMLDELSR